MSIWWCNPASRVSSGPVHCRFSLWELLLELCGTCRGSFLSLQRPHYPLLFCTKPGLWLQQKVVVLWVMEHPCTDFPVPLDHILLYLRDSHGIYGLLQVHSVEQNFQVPVWRQLSIFLFLSHMLSVSFFFISPDNLSSRPSYRSHKLDLSHYPSCSIGRLRHREMESFLRGECQW